ncbi:MAG: hypothetical protein ACRCT2_01910 [Plesiomonas shigelloides]
MTPEQMVERRRQLASKPGALTQAEQAEYDRLGSFLNNTPDSGSSSSSYDSIFRGQGDLLDKANAFTRQQMELSHGYRGREGAWQSQIDEQANRRINTKGDIDKYMQAKGAELTEQAKQNDARRAVVNFRSNGRGPGG